MLNRDDFVDRLSKRGYTKRDARTLSIDVFNEIAEILAEGESLHIYGFGNFEVKDFKEKEIVDINSGEKIILPSYKMPKFVPGEKLKKAVKEGYYRE